ncbi:MAG: gluconokinase [Gemmatimonadales bacterium]
MPVNLTDRGSMNRNVYVVMGVAGSGKSTVGASLAHALGVDFVEGDEYHSRENVRRMAAGTPLTDADRADWLHALAGRIREARDSRTGLVLTCSALKRSYRDVLREADPQLRFVYLKGSESLIARRIAERRGHFMPASLLTSQLAILEEPSADEHAVVCDIDDPAQSIVDAIVAGAVT